MKKVLIFTLCALVIVGLFMACGQDSKPVSVKMNVIRLHILANSDSDSDQSTKLEVRDMILKNWGEKLGALGSTAEAWNTLNSFLPGIKKDIDSLLGNLGASYGSSIETGIYDFPDKDYGGVVFPEGEYRALRIELGSAAGKNWWCVMFPPLCLIGDDGEMDIEKYKELVKELNKQGISPEDAPDAPVRSWFFDQLFSKTKWNDEFYGWAKDYWSEGDD